MQAPRTDEPSEEREMLLAEVRRFGLRHLDAAAIEQAGRVPDDVLDGLRGLGLFGMTLPVEHGGAGLTLADACAVIAELATWDRSVATLVGLHTGLGTRGIVAHGRPDVAAAALSRLATGEWIGAFAATEASAGSDLMAVRTTARFEGGDVVVDGEKSYVTNGRIAGCYTVLARSGARSHALVLVPAAAPGVSVGAEEHKLGIRASSTVTVSLAGVRVPASHVLGAPDRGLEAAYGVLAWGRTLMASGCVGTMRAALGACVAHVTTRTQFRRHLGEFGAVKARVAEQAAMLFASEALLDAAAASLDERTTMAVKVFASERAFEACDGAIQLHGALGVIEDVGIARLLRDCRVTRIFEGANDVLLLRIAAARLTGRGRAPRVRGRPAPCGVPTWPDLAEECDTLAEHIDAAADALRSAYGAAIVGKQGVLLHLGRAEVSHLAAVAAVMHATADTEDVASLAVRRLLHLAAAELDALSDTDEVERVSARIAERLYAAVREPAPEPVREAASERELAPKLERAG